MKRKIILLSSLLALSIFALKVEAFTEPGVTFPTQPNWFGIPLKSASAPFSASGGNLSFTTPSSAGYLHWNGSSYVWDTPANSGGTIGGSGTAGKIPRFITSSTLGNSSIDSDGSSSTANGNLFVTTSVFAPFLGTGANNGTLTLLGGSANEGGKIKLFGAGVTGADDGDVVIFAKAGTGVSTERVRVDGSTGNVAVTNDLTVAGQSVCRKDGTNCPAGNSGTIGGSGTVGKIPRFSTNGSTLGDSSLSEVTSSNGGGKILHIDTGQGSTEIGPQNGGWNHIYTDRPNTIFNTPVYTTAGTFSSYDTANVTLQTGGTPRLTILNSNGNIGIGTISPGYLLHVNGRVNAESNVGSGGYVSTGNYGGTGNAAYFPEGLWSNGSNAWIYGAINTNNWIKDTSDRYLINPAGNTYFNGGNVGIGTASPAQKLVVVGGEADFGNSSYSDPAPGVVYDAKFGGNNKGIAVRGTSYFVGPVGIGVSSPFSSGKLDVRNGVGGSDYGYAINAYSSDTTHPAIYAEAPLLGLQYGYGGNTNLAIGQKSMGVVGKGFIGIYGGGTTYGIYGTVYRGSSESAGWGVFCDSGPDGSGLCGGDKGWNQSSDERLKKNITTITEGLDKILQLRGVTFNWKTDIKNEDSSVGFIAQEVKDIVPEAVNVGPDGYYTMTYDSIVPVLVEAVKELKAKNDDLEKRLEALEAKLK